MNVESTGVSHEVNVYDVEKKYHKTDVPQSVSTVKNLQA